MRLVLERIQQPHQPRRARRGEDVALSEHVPHLVHLDEHALAQPLERTQLARVALARQKHLAVAALADLRDDVELRKAQLRAAVQQQRTLLRKVLLARALVRRLAHRTRARGRRTRRRAVEAHARHGLLELLLARDVALCAHVLLELREPLAPVREVAQRVKVVVQEVDLRERRLALHLGHLHDVALPRLQQVRGRVAVPARARIRRGRRVRTHGRGWRLALGAWARGGRRRGRGRRLHAPRERRRRRGRRRSYGRLAERRGARVARRILLGRFARRGRHRRPTPNRRAPPGVCLGGPRDTRRARAGRGGRNTPPHPIPPPLHPRRHP